MVDRQPFPIPSELTPDTFCLCLQIPNNDDWKQVFNGILAQPTYWFNWARDSEHSGKILADYWTEIYLQIDWTTMSCCCDQPPAIYRYNSDGVYQRSTDGGATWTDAPQYDYRNTSTTFPPPSSLGFTNTKCQNADSMVQVIKVEIVEALNTSFAAAQILALIAAVLLAILSAGSLAALTPLITGIGAAIIDVGVTATQAAFTDDVWNRFRCNIFAHMTTDDSTDAAGLAGILAQINTDETGIAASLLWNIVNAAGLVGINNMIRSNKGSSDADCSCTCTQEVCVPTASGVFVSQDGCVITASSVPEGDHHAIYLWFSNDPDHFNPDACGQITAAHQISGSGVATQAWNDCHTATAHTGSVIGQCACQIYFTLNEPFTTAFTVAAC